MTRREMTDEEILENYDIGLSDTTMKNELTNLLFELVDKDAMSPMNALYLRMSLSKMDYVALCMTHYVLVRSGVKELLDKAHERGDDMAPLIENAMTNIFSVEEGVE